MNNKDHDINSLMPYFEQFVETAKNIAGQSAMVIKTLDKYSHSIISSLNTYQDQLLNIYGPIAKELARRFQELPESFKNALITLGNHGWFCDLEMPWHAILDLHNALSQGNVEDAENALIEYFSERLDSIEASIITKYPNREKIIRSAFNAHRKSEYELSIPVFLAQVDGICYELMNQHFFRSRNSKPRTATYVEQIASDAYRTALLQPLAQTLPINQNEKQRNENFGDLNRHMVLHGESLDYGTKVNSLKVISLINYVAQISI